MVIFTPSNSFQIHPYPFYTHLPPPREARGNGRIISFPDETGDWTDKLTVTLAVRTRTA